MLSTLDGYMKDVLQPRFDQTYQAICAAVRSERAYLDQVFTHSKRNGMRIIILAASSSALIVAAAIFLSVSLVLAIVAAFPGITAIGTLAGCAAGCLAIALALFLRIRVAADELRDTAGELTNHFFEEDKRWKASSAQVQ